MSKYIHNTSGAQKSYQGRPIADGAFFEIEPVNLVAYQSDTDLIGDLAAGTVRMSGDGSTDYSIDGAANVRFLLAQNTHDADTGVVATTPRLLKDDWFLQHREFEFNLSTMNSVHDKDRNGNDLGDTTLKFYDASWTELTTQAAIDAGCVHTVVRFQPSTEYGVKACYCTQIVQPTSNIYAYVSLVTPTELPSPNPSAVFAPMGNGGFNMAFVAPAGRIGLDEPSYIFLQAAQYIRWQFDHAVGETHRIQCVMELSHPNSEVEYVF